MSELATMPKVIIVTGALGGIGRVTSRLLAETGAHLVVTDVIEEGAAAFVDELSALGGEASFFPADLTAEEQVAALVDHTLARFGRLDGAFNNAGIAQRDQPLVEMASTDFAHFLDINVLGTFHCLKYQMRSMTSGGSIVNTSSALGATAVPFRSAYIASKHAVCGLTRAAATEGAPNRIRVNALLPGSTRTAMAEAVFGSLDAAAARRAGRLHLLDRLGEPEEVGFAARWLLSDEASFVTGALIPIDGGTTAGRLI